MKTTTLTASMIATTLLALAVGVGCAAPVEQAVPAVSEDAVVGITDLAILERAFELAPATAENPTDLEKLRSHDCYQALVSQPSYPEFEFRKYANGAAFWAKKGSGFNSGDQRPILCVDLHDRGLSLSGVALDAVIRYDLGRFQGPNSAMGRTELIFERGSMMMRHHLEPSLLSDSVKKRPHELPLDVAPTIAGGLEHLRLRNVSVSTPIYQPEPRPRDMQMSGALAFFVYRYAWRKAENTGRFTVAEDAAGKFAWRAEAFGDGGSYGETYLFSNVTARLGQHSDVVGDGPGTLEELALDPPGERPEGLAPLADCSRKYAYPNGTASFACTGL